MKPLLMLSVGSQIVGALQGGLRQQGLHIESLLDCREGLQKWEDSFALWHELEKKKGKGNGNASTGDGINLDG
jgi:hypothetical protein